MEEALLTDGEQAARSAVDQLLNYAGIRRVICVDDWYEHSDGIDIVLAAVGSGILLGAELVELWPEQETAFGFEDPEIAREVIRSRWQDIGREAQQRLSERAVALTENPFEQDDAPALKALRKILPVEYVALSMAQWRSSYLDFIDDGIPSLVLFDRNFDREGLEPGAGERELIRIQSSLPANWKTGLLTHTVLDADGERQLWTEINLTRRGQGGFIVIAKNRLTESPTEFPGMLKLALLASALQRLSGRIKSSVEQTWSAALEELEGLDPYALHAAVTGNRSQEGSWAPDTLLRMATALCQDKVRFSLHSDKTVHEDATLLRVLEEVELSSGGGEDRLTDQLRVIQRLEYLDEGDHLKQAALPIELGDIFRSYSLTGGHDSTQETSAHFVVLGQPCDLMVRGNGVRGGDRPLVAAAKIDLKKPAKRVRDNQVGQGGEHAFTIPYLDATHQSIGHVQLNRVFFIPVSILDLCVLSQDGSATIKIGDELSDGLLPSWEKRRARLLEWAAEILSVYSVNAELVGDAEVLVRVARALLGIGHLSDLDFALDVEAREISFGVQRVGRLRDPYRGALLIRASQRDARQAFGSWLIDG